MGLLRIGAACGVGLAVWMAAGTVFAATDPWQTARVKERSQEGAVFAVHAQTALQTNAENVKLLFKSQRGTFPF